MNEAYASAAPTLAVETKRSELRGDMRRTEMSVGARGVGGGVRAGTPPTLAPSVTVMRSQQHGSQHHEDGRRGQTAARDRAEQRQHNDRQRALDAEIDGTIVHWQAAAVVQVEAQLPRADLASEVLIQKRGVREVRAAAVTVDELAAAEGRRLVVGAAL